MPRGERPLDSGDSVLLRFAADLRGLRAAAGSPPYRVLARQVHYSTASLSQAAAGRKLPTLAVTLAYVRACGGEVDEWETRWHDVARQLAVDAPEPDEQAPPYVGLAAFQPEDADRFFGRERLVEDLVSRLSSRRLVAVFGASGAGKSSVLRAGLIPRLPATVLLTPGAHPVEELAFRMGRRYEEVDLRSLRAWVREQLADRPDDTELVLVVDQFEEVFTLCRDPAERARFVDLLLAAADGCRVVLGVRADFYGHCTSYPRLVEEFRDAQVPVCPMTADELRSAIVRPAVSADCTVEGALLAKLVAEAHGHVGVLPLLSHALLETWRRRRGNALTLTGFQAAGGIDGALAQTAESEYAELDPHQRLLARNLFLRLTAPGEGTEDTKRRVTRAEIDVDDPATAQVLDRLAGARLLTLDRDAVEITHEALIRGWPRLRDWLAEDRELVRLHRQLTEAADAWEALNRDPGALYRGARLDLAQDMSTRDSLLSRRESEFLEASRHARVREQTAARRRTRRLRQLVTLLSVFLVLAVTATGYAFQARTAADRQRDLAVAQRVAGEARALRAADPAAAAQLSLAAYRLAPTAATRSALLSTFTTPYATQLTGHDNEVNAATYRPGGGLLATASQDHSVRLWDVRDPHRPRVIVTLTGHADSVHSVAFSPSGEVLATGSWDATVRLWDVRDPAAPRLLETLTGFVGNVNSVAFSPDGRRLAAAGDTRVRLWDTTDPRQPAVIAAITVPVSVSVAFSPDGRRLASANTDHTAWLWDLTDLERPRILRGHTEPVTWVAFSPDARLLVTASHDDTARMWDTANPADPPRVLAGHTDTVRAAVFSPDGRVLATGGHDRTTRLWDVATSRQLTSFSGLTGYVLSVAFSPDGRTLAASSKNHTSWLWDLPGSALAGHDQPVCATAFRADGEVLATGSWDRTVRLWRVRDHALLAVLPPHQGSVCGLAFNGNVLATASYDRTARLWDVSDPARPIALFTFTGHQDHVNSVAFTPDGRTLAVASLDGTVTLWDVADRRAPARLAVLTGHRKGVNAAVFSADGTTLATASWDRTVRLWDVRDLRRPVESAVLNGHSDGVIALVLSSDGHTVISGSWDRTVRLWDIRSLKELAVIPHADNINAVALSPDGHTLAAGSWDHTVRLWDVRDPRQPSELAAINGHTDAVWSLAFSPDGGPLATGSKDHTARLLDVDSERVAATICAVAHPPLSRGQWEQHIPQLPHRAPCPPSP